MIMWNKACWLRKAPNSSEHYKDNLKQEQVRNNKNGRKSKKPRIDAA
jgi:hypothetical protein